MWMVVLSSVFFFNDTATTEIYTLSLHALFRSGHCRGARREALREASRGPAGRATMPRLRPARRSRPVAGAALSARRSEEHTSELQSRQYLVCRLLLEKKQKICHSSVLHSHH